MVREGSRVDVLVAFNGGARWCPGTVLEVLPEVFTGTGDRFDVRLDDGRLMENCHPDSMRVIVAEEQRNVTRIGREYA